jgi:hypothetical protein
MNFLQQLLTKSRLLTVLFDNLSADTRSSELYSHVAGYLEKYAAFNHINADTAIDMYTRYITTYNKHCKLFVKTGNYPLAAGITDFTISREEYDLVLILSILFTPHRFRIMQLLQEQSQPAAAALSIGLGSGLEIELTRDRYTEIHAYDLSVNEFLFRQFPGIALNIEQPPPTRPRQHRQTADAETSEGPRKKQTTRERTKRPTPLCPSSQDPTAYLQFLTHPQPVPTHPNKEMDHNASPKETAAITSY